MAKSAARFDGKPPRKGQMELEMFWKEFEAIGPTIQDSTSEEEEPINELEEDVQWLKEAGFDEVVKQYRDSKEIKADDFALENITSSLTRKQADVVKRRINKLNANVKQRTSLDETSSGLIPGNFQSENVGSRQRASHKDIRSIFQTQTVGEASNQEKPSLASRRSYSEGIPLNSRSEVVRSPTSHSQDYLNEISAASSPQRVITTGANVQPRLISKPTNLPPGNANRSPRMKHESAAYAVQLTGKGSHSMYDDARKTTQAQPPAISCQQGAKNKRQCVGGSMFYVTATNSSSNSPNPPDKMKDLSLNDNWMLSDRKDNFSSEKQTDNPASRPEEMFSPSNHDGINETSTFEKVPATDDKPVIESQTSKDNYVTVPKFPVLPNFTLTRDELGVTRIEDLSAHDMEKVRSLALIELTALFDSNNLVFNRRKPTKRKAKEYGIFGVPLLSLIQNDRGNKPAYNTPLILEEMIAFLENNGIRDEGILRVPGSAARIRSMREEIEEKYSERLFSWNGRKPHDVAALLKQFLRELPFPLLTHEYQPTFASVEEILDRVQQLQALNLLVLLLPQAHRDTLRLLLLFLCNVITKRKENKMDLNNVAMIMAPNLFLNTRKARVTQWEVTMAKGTINIVRMLIKYHAILWTVPSFMVRQVRFLYEIESKVLKKDKGKRRKAKKSSDQLPDNANVQLMKSHSLEELDRMEQEFEDHIIRVKAPLLNRIGMAFQLTEDTRARDVVEKFCKGPMKEKTAVVTSSNREDEHNHGHHSHKGNKCPCGDNHFLYEVGGNIGERCLDFATNLLKLSRLNPHAEWVIKTKTIH